MLVFKKHQRRRKVRKHGNVPNVQDRKMKIEIDIPRVSDKVSQADI